MTVRSWTEFRFISEGMVLHTFVSEKEAREWAKRCRALHPKNPELKYVVEEVSICEYPKRRFAV